MAPESEQPMKRSRKDPILVLGAGYAGLTTAAELALRGYCVRVIAKDLGYQPPCTIAGTQSRRWPGIATSTGTFDKDVLLDMELTSIQRFLALAHRPGTGVSVVPGLKVSRKEGLWWNQRPLDVDRKKKSTEVQRALRLAACPPNVGEDVKEKLRAVGYKSIDETQVVKVDSAEYFAYLQKVIKDNGGCICLGRELTAKTVETLRGAAIVNCLGLGSSNIAGAEGDYTMNPGEELLFTKPPAPIPFYIIDDDTNGTLCERGDGALCLNSGAKAELTGGYDEECSAKTVSDADMLSKAIFGKTLCAEDACESWTTDRPTRVGGWNVGASRRSDGQLIVQNNGHAGAGVTVSWGCAAAAVDALVKELMA